MNKEIIESLEWRYACKKFDASKKVSTEDLNTILEATRLTASSYGIQPWKFVLVENTELREKLVPASWNQHQVVEASHLLVFCTYADFDESMITDYVEDIAKTRNQEVSDLEGYQNMMMKVLNKSPEDIFAWAKNQIYIALGNLLTVCAEFKIDTCPMEGFKPKEYDEILGLREKGLRSVVVCPIGYRHVEDKYQHIKKVRYSLDQLVVKI